MEQNIENTSEYLTSEQLAEKLDNMNVTGREYTEEKRGRGNKTWVKGVSGNPGGRPKNSESFVYWYRTFKNMTVSELREWQNNNPEETRTVASDLAYTRILNSKKDLKEFQEIANRSEGMPKQFIENSNPEVADGIKLLRSIIDGINTGSEPDKTI